MILDNFFEPRKKSIVEATMSPGSPALAAPKAPAAPAAPALAAPKTPAAPAPQSNRQYSKTYNAQTKQWTTNAPAANPMAQDPAQRTQNLQQAQQAAQPDTDNDFDSYEQSGNAAVPMTKGGVGQNLYKMPVSQVPQGSNITQKYNNYQQQGDSAYPVEPNGGIQQLAKIPVGQVPKGANITQMPTPGGNLYKDLPGAGTLEEQDQPIDKELVKQIYKNNRDIIGPNPNLIYPKTIIDLPDGTPYEIQPGDTLSKIARKLPVIKAAAQSQIAQAVAPTDAVAAEPSFMDKLKQAASGLAAGQLPSQAIPAAFPSLKKPAPAAPAAATSGTIVNPDWSQTKYANLGPLVKGSDGVWRTQDGKMSAADPEIIAMADKLATSKAAPAPVVKKPPEKVAPADSLNPGEEFVTKSKVKPHLPPRTPSPEPFMPPVAQPRFPHVPSPQPFMPAGANPERPNPPYVPTPRPTGKEPPPTAKPTGIPAAAEKTGRVGEKIGQAYDWLANLVKGRESGGDYDIGYHYDSGTGKVGSDKRLSSAWGAYGMTKAAIASAQAEDPTLNKPIEQWTAKDQDRAFNINNGKNIKRMKDLDVDFAKHPEAPSIAMFLGADGAAEYYKTGKFGKDTLDNHGGEKGVRKIIAKRTKDALDALEMQKKQKEKQKTKESTVAETVHTVKVMLETATTRDDVRRIKDYIDRQYTRHGLSDSVSFAQRNHLVERVIEITGKRLLLT